MKLSHNAINNLIHRIASFFVLVVRTPKISKNKQDIEAGNLRPNDGDVDVKAGASEDISRDDEQGSSQRNSTLVSNILGTSKCYFIGPFAMYEKITADLAKSGVSNPYDYKRDFEDSNGGNDLVAIPVKAVKQ
jgi:hypothetical protein